MFYPDNYDEVKDHERFHHTEKGCDMEYRPSMSDNRNWSQEYFCKTHNVLCSKTGWELGWYQGTRSKYYKEFTCLKCGKVFEAYQQIRHYCDDCLNKKI